jgi:hypothetical protein
MIFIEAFKTLLALLVPAQLKKWVVERALAGELTILYWTVLHQLRWSGTQLYRGDGQPFI